MRIAPAPGDRAWAWLAAAVLVASGANALMFAWVAAIPLPASDAWYILMAFVAPALDGSLGLEHFFAQRGAGDHAQPLQRLVLLAHLHAADLDFRIEALAGVLAAIASCALLGWLTLRGAGTARQRRIATLGAGGVALVGLSLNATGIYTWPLVTMGWLLLLVALLHWMLLARPVPRWPVGVGVAALATFAMALVLDELAMPVVVAVVLARLIHDGLAGVRVAALAQVVGLALGLALARAVIGHLSPVSERVSDSLSSVLARVDSWDAAVTLVGGPMSNALVHASHLAESRAPAWVGVALMALVLVAHAAYWWRALVTRVLPGRSTSIVSMALMLLSYATVAGILLSRVVDFGVDYVHQARYVLFYQLGVVAWLMLFLAPRAATPQGAPAPARGTEPAAMVLFALVLGLQVWLSVLAWRTVPYLQAYVGDAAGMMEDLAAAPESLPPQGCSDIMTVCAEPPQARRAAMALLVGHRLNLFSPDFRRRHGLALRDEPDPGLVLSAAALAACADPFRAWGPTEITAGEPFNRQPDGSMAYWLKLAPDLPGFQLFAGEGGPRLQYSREPDVVTLLHTPALEAMVAAGGPVRLHLRCQGGPSKTLEIPVR